MRTSGGPAVAAAGPLVLRVVADLERADGQLAGEPVKSGVRKHGGTGGNDVELPGQGGGIPAAEREDAGMLRRGHRGRPARRRVPSRRHGFLGAALV
jgi:hypothetical protein